MRPPASSVVAPFLLVLALLVARTAAAEESLAPGYWVEDEKGKCLDGSPPVYYHRPGMGDGANRWLLYYEGGGWCSNTQECYDRALTDLGSSRHYDKANPLDWDMLASDPKRNPTLFSWNIVFVKYCDGGFFSSNRTDVEVHRGKQLYYRGKFIQEAIFRDLVAHRGMDKATEVIFGGCSAGAMAAAVQVDHWAASNLFPPSVRKITAVPDSGFLLPYDGPERCKGYESRMLDFYRFMSVQWALPAGCLARHTRDPWRCLFFLENSIPYVKTPLFVLQSRFDRWQREEHSLFCGKIDDAAANNHFGQTFEQRFYAVVGRNAKDGYLLDSCVRHCGAWSVVESDDGLTQEAAFRQWYQALPPTIRVSAPDTPQSIGRTVTAFFIQKGLLSLSDVVNILDPAAAAAVVAIKGQWTTTAAADGNDQEGEGENATPAAPFTTESKPQKRRRKSFWSVLFPPRRHRRHDDAPPTAASLTLPIPDSGTPLSPFRFNNTGAYPCTDCCRSGYGQRQGAAAAVGLHTDMAMLSWPRWPERGAGGNPVEGEARAAAGRGMDGEEEGGEKEGVQAVEIDGMGNVLLPGRGGPAARGEGGRMLRLQRF